MALARGLLTLAHRYQRLPTGVAARTCSKIASL